MIDEEYQDQRKDKEKTLTGFSSSNSIDEKLHSNAVGAKWHIAQFEHIVYAFAA